MRGVSRAPLHGLLDDFEFDRRADWLLARWLTAALDESMTPASTKCSCQRQMVVFEIPASRMIAMTIGYHHDPPALDDLLSRVPVGEKTLKFSARFALEHDGGLSIRPQMNHSRRRRIQMFVMNTSSRDGPG
jgi:hypothetical protein